MKGLKVEAVADSLRSEVPAVVGEVKGSLVTEVGPVSYPLPNPAGNRTGGGSDWYRVDGLRILVDRVEFSSGENAVSRVSGVPSCLHESAPPGDE